MINILDQNTINKIAAGEVIERPMSIVKELVENSLDANATNITVEIKNGGISYIRVTDNGDGIDKDEVRKAYMRHATSKLLTSEDLEGIMTLGFRGEALSTIAAVTETEMVTKKRDSLTGVRYMISGGKEIEFSEAGAPDGTTIISKNIFFNTPARLKFLKTSVTEGSYINDLMIRISLSHPSISFRLISNGKTVLSTSGNGKVKDTIYGIYGRDISNNLLPVDHTSDGIKISGYIGKPFISKGNRSFENYFVNGRYITNVVIAKAIEEAYKTRIMQHKFPFTALFFQMDPTMCDVNIHPTKKEFKYYNEKALFSATFHAVSDALSEREYMPDFNISENKTGAEKRVVNNSNVADSRTNDPGNNSVHMPRNTSTVSNINDTVSNTNNTASNTNDTVSNTNNTASNTNDTVNNNKNTSAGTNLNSKNSLDGGVNTSSNESDSRNADNSVKNVINNSNTSDSGINNNIRNLENTAESKSNTVSDSASTSSGTVSNFSKHSSNNNTLKPNIKKPSMGSYSILEKLLPKEYLAEVNEKSKIYGEEKDSAQNKTEDYKDESAKIFNETHEQKEIETVQKNLFDDDYISKEAISHHKIIGLAFDTYWITQYNDTLYLMDQHAAHEKVNYERFLKAFKERSIVSQKIFPPEVISLSAVEMDAVMKNREYFLKSGFEIDEFGGNEVKLSAMPVNFIDISGRDVFLEFVSYLTQNISGINEDIFVHRLATMGCKAAVKGNQKISFEEAQHLIEDLLTLENPYTCPHGRPTIIKLTKQDLEKKFKRIVN
ncbi:DNA mismatch repair endonuclease MutL [Eubacterium ruminantium]|uniref:DNA mismatch repair endonuclease MutL n=1 Tax=Eubacterium ruminantium TaxID=42322 RepID=UPI0015699154|nr:DNA mismatch repair endonuclease MutL [Eubacterium ruminantium]